jgi:hypothetical protein
VAFRFAVVVEKAAVGRGRRREKKRESTRSYQTASVAGRASTPLSICLSDLQGRDEAVAQKGVHFGTHQSRVSVHASHEALTLHSPWLTLLARCECLKQHGVGEGEGELSADFTSIVPPIPVRENQERTRSRCWTFSVQAVFRRSKSLSFELFCVR